MKIRIIVATHKKYWMPDDEIYLPLHVGAEGKKDAEGNDLDFGYAKDNTGDNISKKNPNYCELTGLYWAWKNLDADYIGLAHYRRHFSSSRITFDKKQKVITKAELEKALSGYEVIVPKPRNYWIETNYSQYAHAHHAIDLDTTRTILAERYPTYVAAFDKSMKRTVGHRFNMFIMTRERLSEYCTWLFDVLFELERRLDISSYSKNDSRVFGFVSERLLDVWLETNAVRYREMGYVFMEKQNWFVKGYRFISRKLARGNKAD